MKKIQAQNEELRMAQSCKAVFFDFGDTLAFNNMTFPDSLRCVLSGMGADIDAEVLREIVHKADDELRTERLLARSDTEYREFRIQYYSHVLNLLGIADLGGENACYLQNVIDYYHGVYLKPETQYILDILRHAGLKLGMVSNFSHVLPKLLKNLGIFHMFDFITYSDDVGYDKPSPIIFEDALAKLGEGIQPNEVIHIGDSYEGDVLGARHVGIIPILLDPEGGCRQQNCLCINNLLEIADLLGICHPLTSPQKKREMGQDR